MPRTPLKAPLVGANARHSSAHVEHFTPPEVIDAAREVLGEIDLDPASSDLANRVVGARRIFDVEDNGFKQLWDSFTNPARVFLNPPGGASDNLERRVLPKCRESGACGLAPGHAHAGVDSNQKKWWFKLAREYVEGRVESAVFVGFSVEILQTTQVEVPMYELPRETGQPRFTQPLPIPLHFPMCFPSRRLAYYTQRGNELVRGGSPPHASVLVYLPPRSAARFGIGLAQFERVFGKLGQVVRPQRLAFEVP